MAARPYIRLVRSILSARHRAHALWHKLRNCPQLNPWDMR
jgi:hypothetical protein